jgi:hypothetical protein
MTLAATADLVASAALANTVDRTRTFAQPANAAGLCRVVVTAPLPENLSGGGRPQ